MNHVNETGGSLLVAALLRDCDDPDEIRAVVSALITAGRHLTEVVSPP